MKVNNTPKAIAKDIVKLFSPKELAEIKAELDRLADKPKKRK